MAPPPSWGNEFRINGCCEEEKSEGLSACSRGRYSRGTTLFIEFARMPFRLRSDADRPLEQGQRDETRMLPLRMIIDDRE
jgi:hypothetical protein